MRVARLLPLGFVALAAVAAAGCNEFHYYDIDVSFSGGLTGNDVQLIQFCTMTVSGADSKSTRLGPNGNGFPIMPLGSTHLGIVEAERVGVELHDVAGRPEPGQRQLG